VFRPSRSERGFILISAIWLLVLCGSIAAILMLRSIGAARESALDAAELADKALLEAAVETTFAGLLFTGGRSHAASVPASGEISIDGTNVLVELTSETGRIDLNEYPLPKLAAALQGLGVEASQRERVIGALQIRRASRSPLTSQPEVSALLAGIAGPGLECLEQEFTIFSGYSEPRPTQMSERLARALALGQRGQSPASMNPEPIGAGTPLRVKARIEDGAELLVVARLTGLQPDPVAVFHWDRTPGCSAG
jgi:hypothetical protein